MRSSGGSHEGWQICEAYSRDFPGHLRAYGDFLKLPGTDLKLEHHTTIRRVQPAGPGGREFVLKQYDYSRLAQLRSWQRISKAEREFQALSFCHDQGLPAVGAVGFGTRRTSLGQIASCFLITDYVPDHIALRDWLRQGHGRQDKSVDKLIEDLGRHVRIAHARHFFFFRLLAKNILVQEVEDNLDWLLLDQGYARHYDQAIFARSAQLRDIGGLTGSVERYLERDVTDAFLAGYLPDPLGATETSLRRRIARGVRIYENKMPATRLIHTLTRKHRRTP